jgi:thioesterase DpgC
MERIATLAPEQAAWAKLAPAEGEGFEASEAANGARESFMRAHAQAVWDLLTADAGPLRDSELLDAAAERFPNLVPGPEALAAEAQRPLADKQGVEIAQGIFLAHILGAPSAGAQLIWAMLRPTREALERLDEFRASGEADLNTVRVTRRGKAGILELRNPRHLNAEDDTTVEASEVAACCAGRSSITPATRAAASSAPG